MSMCLARKLSKRHPCTANVSYGCEDHQVWVQDHCSGMFNCPRSGKMIVCGASGRQDRQVCSCPQAFANALRRSSHEPPRSSDLSLSSLLPRGRDLCSSWPEILQQAGAGNVLARMQQRPYMDAACSNRELGAPIRIFARTMASVTRALLRTNYAAADLALPTQRLLRCELQSYLRWDSDCIRMKAPALLPQRGIAVMNMFTEKHQHDPLVAVTVDYSRLDELEPATVPAATLPKPIAIKQRQLLNGYLMAMNSSRPSFDDCQDPRAFMWQGKAYVICWSKTTFWDPGRKCAPKDLPLVQCLDNDEAVLLAPPEGAVKTKDPLRTLDLTCPIHDSEKNWSPLVVSDALHFVYSHDPVLQVLRLGSTTGLGDGGLTWVHKAQEPSIEPCRGVRGGSPYVPWGNGYQVALAHVICSWEHTGSDACFAHHDSDAEHCAAHRAKETAWRNGSCTRLFRTVLTVLVPDRWELHCSEPLVFKPPPIAACMEGWRGKMDVQYAHSLTFSQDGSQVYMGIEFENRCPSLIRLSRLEFAALVDETLLGRTGQGPPKSSGPPRPPLPDVDGPRSEAGTVLGPLDKPAQEAATPVLTRLVEGTQELLHATRTKLVDGYKTLSKEQWTASNDFKSHGTEQEQIAIGHVEQQLKGLLSSAIRPLKVVEMHCHDPTNIGDVYSSPFEHFPLLRQLRTTSVDMEPAGCSPVVQPRGTLKALANNRTLFIIGGGGLIAPNGGGFSEATRTACTHALCIIWSIGTNSRFNNHGDLRRYELNSKAANAKRLMSDYRAISHVGRPPQKLPGVLLAAGRDFGVQLPEPWVPLMDASCMLRLECMGKHPNSRNTPRLSYYLHKDWAAQYLDLDNVTDLSGPRMLNSESNIDTVLNFLCATDVLVTTSYHGAYWAALMGKRVVALNTAMTSKYLYFPFAIEIVHLERGQSTTADQLREAIGRARSLSSTVLQEERKRTLQFYERVLLTIRSLLE